MAEERFTVVFSAMRKIKDTYFVKWNNYLCIYEDTTYF